MFDYHKYKKEDGSYLRVAKDKMVDLALFKSSSQVSVAITYSLLNKKRVAKFGKYRYGASNMYLPRLYEILSKRFNGGLPLIDRYLHNIGKREIGKAIREFVQDIANSLMEEREDLISKQRMAKHGGFDQRLRVFKALREFVTIKNKRLEDNARYIEKIVQDDIYRLMSIGKLPLEKKFVTDVTVAAREKIGYDVPADIVFFTTGQLASSIRLHFDIQLHESEAAHAV